jgi:ferric-dicitrate binding protein FerR (iron transport regulator)
MRWFAGLAALLLVGSTLSVAAYRLASRPVIVGQLTQATNSRWHASQPDIAVGSLLNSGQELRLAEGTALITFVSGAQVLMEAPAAIRLDQVKLAHLHDGRIAVRVPTPAMGFTITTGLADFIDLGTEFTLNLQADKSFDIFVFEGLVELRLAERFGRAARQPLRAPEVTAYHFDVDSADIEKLHFTEGLDMPF